MWNTVIKNSSDITLHVIASNTPYTFGTNSSVIRLVFLHEYYFDFFKRTVEALKHSINSKFCSHSKEQIHLNSLFLKNTLQLKDYLMPLGITSLS